MIGVIGYFGCALVGIAIVLTLLNNRKLRSAEQNMANLMQLALTRDKLEELRTVLLETKSVAVRIGFDEMELIYDAEHQLNLIAIKLDQMERTLIEQGLQQPSETGRISYMLKLIDLSMNLAH